MVVAVVSLEPTMRLAIVPVLNTILFTIVVPGTVTGVIPHSLLGGYSSPALGPLAWLGMLTLVVGAAIYFRCAWEFAVRGLGTPAPIAPTKLLVVSGLHRFVRNPMDIGARLVVIGE